MDQELVRVVKLQVGLGRDSNFVLVNLVLVGLKVVTVESAVNVEVDDVKDISEGVYVVSFDEQTFPVFVALDNRV